VASRWSLKPATDVRFVHSLPQRDRSAARISGSDPEDSGSNPLPAANKFHAGVVQLDQDTRLRTERLEGSNPSARTISAPRPKDQGTALRRLESAFESPGADHHVGQAVTDCPRPSEARRIFLRAGDRVARCPAVYRVEAGSIPVPRAKFFVMGQSTTGRVPSLSKR
jgi:hypothetical protein